MSLDINNEEPFKFIWSAVWFKNLIKKYGESFLPDLEILLSKLY